MNSRIAFLILSFLAIGSVCLASRTNLPPAQAATIAIDPDTHLVTWPGDFLASNGLARVNGDIMIADLVFTNWGTTDGVTWTNDTGWTSTAVVTNGVCNLATNSLLSPWITGYGLAGISVTWSNLLNLGVVVEYTTNSVEWIPLTSLSGLRIAVGNYRLRFSTVNNAPPLTGTAALLNRVRIYGHRFPARIGSMNDFSGIIVRVDRPVDPRDAVNLKTLDERLSDYVSGGQLAGEWSHFAATNTVDLAGQALQLDPRYRLSISGDTVTLAFLGASIMDITAAGTCTPRIVMFRVAGTNITAAVVGVAGWRPYPQWTDTLGSSWQTLDTNQFNSTFPNITNGLFSMSWSSTNTTEFWRIIARDETLGTNGNGLITFHAPLSVPALIVGGKEMSPYSATWTSNANYAVSSSVAQVSIESAHAVTSDIAQVAGNAQAADYAAAAGNAATAMLATESAHAARADAAGTAGYATNSAVAARAAYATNSGYATTAGQVTFANFSVYATNSGTAARSAYATNSGYATTAGQATVANSSSYATNSGSAKTAGLATNGWIGGSFIGFGTAAASDSTNFSAASWLVNIEPRTNLVVTSSSGVNYNGPTNGTLFVFSESVGGVDTWITQNPLGIYIDMIPSMNEYYAFVSTWGFEATNRLGTYHGVNNFSTPGTGTFSLIESYYLQTNWIPYFADGTACVKHVTGPATNQFAAHPVGSVWSGSWTNILAGITNVLLFLDGFAKTNLVNP